jgi:hypothetical protein
VRIWVLRQPGPDFLAGAQWQGYVDDWTEQHGDYSCAEARANGPDGPVRGFGRLWCRQREVWRVLGQPVGPEAGSGDEAPFASAQYFEGGVMFFRPKRNDALNTSNQVFVLFNGADWRRLEWTSTP